MAGDDPADGHLEITAPGGGPLPGRGQIVAGSDHRDLPTGGP